jgi:hypothetical protein
MEYELFRRTARTGPMVDFSARKARSRPPLQVSLGRAATTHARHLDSTATNPDPDEGKLSPLFCPLLNKIRDKRSFAAR